MKNKMVKISVIAVIVAEIFALSIIPGFAETNSLSLTKFIPGDINNDYEVNIDDVTIIQKSIAGIDGLSDDQQLAADFDGNSQVEISDVTEIQKKIANQDYQCIAKPDNSYEKIKVKKVNDIAFENTIITEKVFDGYDYTFDRAQNKNGIYLIKSTDEYYDLFGYYQSAFDKNFFKDNSLVVWTEYIPENCNFIYDFREITKMSVDNSTLNLNCVIYSPFLDTFYEPYNRNYNLFYKVKKADIEKVNNINICCELININR